MALDRVSVLAGIAGELRAFGELVGSLNMDSLVMPTRCAGWSVTDIAAHVVGTVADIAQGRLEGQGTPAVTRRQAHERAGRTVRELTDELANAAPVLFALLASLPEEAWEGPAPNDPDYTLGFAVESIWYDAYLHGDDVRHALGLPSADGPGLRAAVHHVAGYLQYRAWGPATLLLNGIEPIQIGGGGLEIIGDPLEFVLVATGRLEPALLGLDPTIDVYADEKDSSAQTTSTL
jgi:uncharacterized protein (TIGR03083 family)